LLDFVGMYQYTTYIDEDTLSIDKENTMTKAQRKAQTPKFETPIKKDVFEGMIVYKAFNPITRKMEVVTPESEIGADQMVMPMFWHNESERYMTVPGTEVYGYVPC
jgi:hypothetical protein